VSARRAHRWLGLAFGLWFALAGLSGAVLVFWKEIEAAPLPVPSAGAPLPLDALLARAEAARGEAAWRVFPGERLRVEFLGDGGRVSLYLDPADGRVLATLPWGGAAIHWLHMLHSGHLLGRAGGVAAGLAGLALLALLAAGLALWPRHPALPWRERLWLTPGLRGRRRQANRHRALGWRLAPLLAVAALSGTTLAFPDTTRAVLEPVLAPAPSAPDAPKPAARAPGLDAAVALAEARLPAWRLAWLVLPEEARDPLTVVLLPRDARWPSGRAWVEVGPKGHLLDAGMPDGVDHARAWLMALHNGQWLPWAGRGMVVATGLSLPVFLWLGISLWARSRRRDRTGRDAPGRVRGARAASARATAPPPPRAASAPPAP